MTTVRKVLNLMQIKDILIIGSFNDPRLKYKSDIDVNEFIKSHLSKKDIYKMIKEKYIIAEQDPNIWITDFKLGNIKGEDLHWTKDDIANGYIKVDDKKYYFWDLLNQKSTIKLDIIANINGRFGEFSDNYFFFWNDGSNTQPFKKSIKESLLLDCINFIKDEMYFKALKRLYAYYKQIGNHEKVNDMATFFNSSIGKLNRQLASLKIIQLLLEQDFRKVSIEDIVRNLKMIKSKIPKKLKPLIQEIMDQSTMKDISKYLDSAIESINTDLNNKTVKYLDKYID